MKIASIDCFPVRLERALLIVRVETDTGLVGWGESGFSTRDGAVTAMVAHLRPALIGADAFAIGQHWQRSYRGAYFEGCRTTSAAISAIDIALHDIKAKALGVPVYELLGGRQRTHVEVFATARFDSVDGAVDRARRLAGEGFRSIRLRLQPAKGEESPIFEPRTTLGTLHGAVAAVREELGRDMHLGLELHHQYSVAEAAQLLQALPPGALDYVEEPIRCESVAAYKQLRSLTPVPFAIGEEFASKWQFLPYFEAGLMAFNRLDVCNIGGFTEAMKVASMSEAQYVDLMPHNPLGPICTAATVQLCAAVPNFAYMEQRQRREGRENNGDARNALFVKAPQLDGISFPVTDAPGLGIEIDEDALRAASADFTPEFAPALARLDGSITNR